MPTRDEPWPAGTPDWVDLSTPDVEAAKEFYGALLGWEFREAGGGYWLCTYGGREAAGVMPGEAAAWTVYLASDDVDATARAVEQAGGQVLLGPSRIPPYGAMAYAADPTGARFGIWQAGALPGVTVYDEPGSLTWEEAVVVDPDAAKSFYSSVFGYRFDPVPGDVDYALFALDGEPLGGLGAVGDDEQPGWRAYFAVTDADVALTLAQDRGGRVLMPAVDTPWGRLARVADPFGAELTLIGMGAA